MQPDLPWLIPCPARGRLAVAAGLLGAVALAGLLATSAALPMVWDEGNAILRAEGIARWAASWFQADQPHPLSAEVVAADWRYTTQVEGHPAGYGILIAAGRALSGCWLAPLDSARFGPMALFALASAALFYRLARQWSIAAGLVAWAALLLMPRMFSHAHFASFDGPVTAAWLLAWAAFAPARRRAAWAVVWGLCLGLGLSCKFTGWIAPLVYLVWAVGYGDRPGLKALAVGLPVSLATFWALNPPLWHAPLSGLEQFFDLNLHRGANPGLNISTQFLGQMYNLDFPLPWYNTLFWTAVAVPSGILLLAALGLGVSLRRARSDPQGLLVAALWAALVLLRAIPGAPVHDGIRLFLPSFAMLAALAGLGAHCALEILPRKRLTAALTALLLLGNATSLVWYWPQGLSYYNLLIGGLPGATALGMEPTYYWDGLDREALAWLRQNTTAGEQLAFGAHSPENLQLMHQWGLLPCAAFVAPATTAPALPAARWYVLQRRPSGLRDADQRLIQQARPVYQKFIRRRGWGAWRLDVPLVEIYRYADYRDAAAAN